MYAQLVSDLLNLGNQFLSPLSDKCERVGYGMILCNWYLATEIRRVGYIPCATLLLLYTTTDLHSLTEQKSIGNSKNPSLVSYSHFLFVLQSFFFWEKVGK